MKKPKPQLPEHLVTKADYMALVGALKKPKRVRIEEYIDGWVVVTVTRTRWQYWTTFSKNYKRDIENAIGRRKAVMIQVEVIVE